MTAIDSPPPPGSLTARRGLLSYLLVGGVVCFAMLGQADLTRMEPIIVLGGRHMRDTGQWFIPRLYGEIYAFKPALAYWLAVATESVVGPSEFAARVPTALCGLLLGLLIQQSLSRLVSPRCGLTGGLLAVTSMLFVEQARMVGFDMPLALGVGIATLAACRNLSAGRSDLRWWMLGYVGLLFGFLAKGLPAVLIYAPGLGLATLLLRENRLLVRWQHVLGVILFLAGASLYIWLAYREAGPSAWAQHLDEIRSRSSAWSIRTLVATLAKPAVVFAAFLPGSLLALGLVRKKQWSRLPAAHSRLAVAAWAFLVAGVAMFMLSPATNTRYFLPLATAVAIIAALAMEARSARGCECRPESPRRFSGLRRMDAAAWVILAGLVLWSGYVCGVEPARVAKRSLRSVAVALTPDIPAGETLFVDFGDSYSSLIYYLGHPVQTRLVNDPPPAEPVFVLLTADQADLLAARPDLVIRRVRDERSAAGAGFVLAIVSRVGAAERMAGTPPAACERPGRGTDGSGQPR